MNVNQKLRIVSTALVVTMVLPASAALPARDSSKATVSVNTTDPKVLTMVNRLEEIKLMDKTNLTSTERKALRKEVRKIKKEMKANNQGVYLSVGAIIIIILLLILIL